MQLIGFAGWLGKLLTDAIQEPAKGVLTIRSSNWLIKLQATLFNAFKLSIVSKAPHSAPQFAYEGMRVLQAYLAAVRTANMTNDHFTLDRVLLNELGDFGIGAGRRVTEQTTALAFIKGNPPAVTMRAGAPAPFDKPGNAKHDIGGCIGTHAE